MNKLKEKFGKMKLWQKVLCIVIILAVIGAIIWGISSKVTKTTEQNQKQEMENMVISPKKDWGVNFIKSNDEAKYTVQQWNNDEYIVTTYYVPNPKSNDCSTRFQLMKVNTKDSIEQVKQKDADFKSGLKYTEKKYGKYTFYDLQHKQTKKDMIYAEGTHSGYFEKDGYIWAYKYERYVGVDEALQTQIINDVLNNMKIFK